MEDKDLKQHIEEVTQASNDLLERLFNLLDVDWIKNECTFTLFFNTSEIDKKFIKFWIGNDEWGCKAEVGDNLSFACDNKFTWKMIQDFLKTHAKLNKEILGKDIFYSGSCLKCGEKIERTGYDDANWWEKVGNIKQEVCCGKCNARHLLELSNLNYQLLDTINDILMPYKSPTATATATATAAPTATATATATAIS